MRSIDRYCPQISHLAEPEPDLGRLAPMSLRKVMKFFRSYDKSAYEVFACQGSEPSESDVAAFEAEVGFRLEAEFREFTMGPLGGLYMEVREELWPRPKPYQVGAFWTFLYALIVPGISAELPEWLDVREETKRMRESGIMDLVPCLRLRGDADVWCVNREGRIIRWSHEEPEKRREEKVGFGELLMREIRELEGRLKEQKKTNRNRNPRPKCEARKRDTCSPSDCGEDQERTGSGARGFARLLTVSPAGRKAARQGKKLSKR